MIEQLTFWQQIGATILFLLLAFIADRLREIIRILKK